MGRRKNKENKLLSLHDEEHPSCTTLEKYKHWRSIAPQALRAGFCTDCTREFQTKMLREKNATIQKLALELIPMVLLKGTPQLIRMRLSTRRTVCVKRKLR